MEVQFRVRGFNIDTARLVFAWLYRLCDEAFGATGHGTSGGDPWGWSLSLASGATVELSPRGKRQIVFSSDDDAVASRLPELAEQALERATSFETGPPIWWTAHYTSKPFGVANLMHVQGMRILSEQRLLADEEGIDGFAYLKTNVDYADPAVEGRSLVAAPSTRLQPSKRRGQVTRITGLRRRSRPPFGHCSCSPRA